MVAGPDSVNPDASTTQVLRRCRHCGQSLPPTATFCSRCGGSVAGAASGADPLRETVRALFGPDLDIEQELGRGGMAVVYAAFDPALQRRVAVKVLLPEIAADASMADRFLREARTVAALQHPNVVTIHGVRSGAGVQAIVMQFVEGRSLDVILAERGRLPVHVAGLLLSQAAAGLQHAHDRGVVHRDVKPANVLIDHDGHAIVSDFGIARRENAPRTTGTGLVVGTWAYMSPEQRSAEQVTPATDQYAFGVMAFELLTGQLPFNGPPAEMLRAHLVDPVPSLRALRSDIPVAVETAVQRMLAKAPSDRWPSLREAERIFHDLVPDEGQTTLQVAAYTRPMPAVGGSTVMAAVPRRVAAPPVTGAHRATPEESGPATADVSASPSRAPWIAAAIVALAALGAWAALGRTPSASPVTRAAVPVAEPAPSVAPVAPSMEARASDPPGRAASGNRGGPGTVLPQGAIVPAPLASAPATRDEGGRPATRNEPTSPVRADSASMPARTVPSYAVADARRLGREFVTLLNQRRARDLARLAAIEGDAATRAELIRLTESAADFAAGFDRVPSAPEPWSSGFETEFHVDLEWRGGHKVMRIRLYASPAEAGWKMVGFAADIP